jgi:hypothetical protein
MSTATTRRELCSMTTEKSQSGTLQGDIRHRDTPEIRVRAKGGPRAFTSLPAEGEDEAAKDLEEWQTLRIAELRRLIVSPERADEIQQVQPCEDIGRPFYTSAGGQQNGRRAPNIRIDNQTRKNWESQLAKSGLSLQQQKLQNTQDVVVPFPNVTLFGREPSADRCWGPKCEICNARNCEICPPAYLPAPRYDRNAFERVAQTRLGGNKIAWINQAKKALDYSDLVFTASYRGKERTRRSFAPVRIREHGRNIPNWACDDNQLEELLWEMYPKWQTDNSHHKRAAIVLSVLYRYFRQLDHTQTIAEDLGLNQRAVEYRVAKARKASGQQRQ